MNKTARVALVGAGPGDPDLLTVKALRLIESADVVVYDRLVSPEILALVPRGTTRIYVGKADGHHSLPQPRINELLVSLARGGRQVVRLKGGDPYLFGRGSEEAAWLAARGIAFEVVPGITAAACTAYAGIPLTHRGLANGVRIIPGHTCGQLEIDWRGVADPDTTLVIYMGAHNLAQLCAQLAAAGLAADTPAAAIENGTTPRQRQLVSTLARLPGDAACFGLRSPALIVIGRVVSLAASLQWFSPDAQRQDPDWAHA